MNSLQRADVAPTTVQREALVAPLEALAQVMTAWTAITTTELASLNRELGAASLPPVNVR